MQPAPTPKRFYRTTRSDAKIAGVCGGIARYFGWDPTLVRVLWVLGTILFFLVAGIVAYIVLALVAPSEDTLQPPPPPAPGPVFR